MKNSELLNYLKLSGKSKKGYNFGREVLEKVEESENYSTMKELPKEQGHFFRRNRGDGRAHGHGSREASGFNGRR